MRWPSHGCLWIKPELMSEVSGIRRVLVFFLNKRSASIAKNCAKSLIRMGSGTPIHIYCAVSFDSEQRLCLGFAQIGSQDQRLFLP